MSGLLQVLKSLLQGQRLDAEVMKTARYLQRLGLLRVYSNGGVSFISNLHR